MSLVSVVIPARDAELTIGRAIASVLSMSQVLEVIIVDDGSLDRTREIALGFSDPRVRVIEGPERGIAASLNTGFLASMGEFIARCDADDWYEPNRLGWQIEAFKKYPGTVAVSGGFSTVDCEGRFIADLATHGDVCDVSARLLSGEAITTFCSWLVRRNVIELTGGAREWFATSSDVDLQFRIAQYGAVMHFPRKAYWYRLHDGSITHTQNHVKRHFFEKCATDFAIQRKFHGRDNLELNIPPKVPAGEAVPSTAYIQIAGQLTGQAWRHHALGHPFRGAMLICKALTYDPKGVFRYFRQLILILIR